MYEDISSVQGGRLSLYTYIYTVRFDFLQILPFSYTHGLYVNIYTSVFSHHFHLEILLMGLSDYLVLLFPLACR